MEAGLAATSLCASLGGEARERGATTRKAAEGRAARDAGARGVVYRRGRSGKWARDGLTCISLGVLKVL